MTAQKKTQRKLSTKQRKAIRALLAGMNVSDAADAADVARGTLYTWFDNPDFMAELRAAEQKALDDVARRMAGLTDKAVNVLKAQMEDERSAQALRAARTVIDAALRLREAVALEERIAALEAQVEK